MLKRLSYTRPNIFFERARKFEIIWIIPWEMAANLLSSGWIIPTPASFRVKCHEKTGQHMYFNQIYVDKKNLLQYIKLIVWIIRSQPGKLFDLAVCPHLYLKWTMGDEVCGSPVTEITAQLLVPRADTDIDAPALKQPLVHWDYHFRQLKIALY